MPKLTEPGTYTMRVRETALSESKASKSPQIVVTFADPVNGDHITAFLSCAGGAWQYTEQTLRDMGWDAAQRGYRFEELNDEPSPLADVEMDVVCDFETYNGKTDLRVKYINRPGESPGMRRMDPAEAASFADRLRNQLGVSGASSRRAGPPRQRNSKPAQVENPAQVEDDVPF